MTIMCNCKLEWYSNITLPSGWNPVNRHSIAGINRAESNLLVDVKGSQYSGQEVLYGLYIYTYTLINQLSFLNLLFLYLETCAVPQAHQGR